MKDHEDDQRVENLPYENKQRSGFFLPGEGSSGKPSWYFTTYRVTTKRVEVLSLQGDTQRRQGATGAGCTERGFLQ